MDRFRDPLHSERLESRCMLTAVTFVEHRLDPLPFSSIYLGDFDSDSNPDFIGVAHRESEFVEWWELDKQNGDMHLNYREELLDAWWLRVSDVNQDDLVTVFAAGKFETGSEATFDEGDWNQDGFFDSADMVLAFQAGHYVAASTPWDIAAAVDRLFEADETRHSANR